MVPAVLSACTAPIPDVSFAVKTTLIWGLTDRHFSIANRPPSTAPSVVPWQTTS